MSGNSLSAILRQALIFGFGQRIYGPDFRHQV
jgi:hypothetical protein